MSVAELLRRQSSHLHRDGSSSTVAGGTARRESDVSDANDPNPTSATDDLLADLDAGGALRIVARTASEPSIELIRQALVARVPELAALANVPQDPGWHPEGDVLTHSLLAMDAAARICRDRDHPVDRRGAVVLAALLHDVGKPSTTRREGASVTSRGHAEVGEGIVLRVGDRLGWQVTETRAISALVRHHMAHVSVQGDPSPRAVARLQTRLLAAGTSLDEWSIVVDADGESRGSASRPNRAEPWLRVAASGDLPAPPRCPR